MVYLPLEAVVSKWYGEAEKRLAKANILKSASYRPKDGILLNICIENANILPCK